MSIVPQALRWKQTWKTCDHVWDIEPGCPRIPQFAYCMRCGRRMTWIEEHQDDLD